MEYVAGFLFSADRKQVVLVEKIKPDWQRGRLNGVGGKIERSDASPVAAMVREFGEEAGLLIHEWELFCQIENRGNLTYFFRSFAESPVDDISGQEVEKITAYPVSDVAGLNTMPNLGWLIPMALDLAVLETTVDYAW
ncbi:MAG: NUDIX domain-containing protein [Rubrobacter sp.]|nr:NUDIX domain-containing protein [Rubrobacter sp.]